MLLNQMLSASLCICTLVLRFHHSNQEILWTCSPSSNIPDRVVWSLTFSTMSLRIPGRDRVIWSIVPMTELYTSKNRHSFVLWIQYWGLMDQSCYYYYEFWVVFLLELEVIAYSPPPPPPTLTPDLKYKTFLCFWLLFSLLQSSNLYILNVYVHLSTINHLFWLWWERESHQAFCSAVFKGRVFMNDSVHTCVFVCKWFSNCVCKWFSICMCLCAVPVLNFLDKQHCYESLHDSG